THSLHAALPIFPEPFAAYVLRFDKVSAQLHPLPAGIGHILNRPGVNALVFFKAVGQRLHPYGEVVPVCLRSQLRHVRQGLLVIRGAGICHAQHGVRAYPHRILGAIEQAEGVIGLRSTEAPPSARRIRPALPKSFWKFRINPYVARNPSTPPATASRITCPGSFKSGEGIMAA